MSANAAGGWLERQFKLSQLGTNVQTEIIAGLTTFMVMSYIIAVNPATLTFGGTGELSVTQVATVTCLVAGVMSIIMGLYTNRAIALAPGLGINAIVAYTLVGSMGLSFPEAMGVIVTEGLIITLLVVTGVRRYVLEVVPLVLKKAISVGIGFFILFLGLKNAGVIRFHSGVFGENGEMGTFTGRLDLAPLNTWPIFVAMIGILVVISIMLSDFFDTMGTLIGVGAQAGYLDENGEFPDADKPLMVDSVAAIAGGAMSASSATSYIESAAGVSVGGRSGLVVVVTGILFLLALPFVALVEAIPGVATAPALIVVGLLMTSVLADDDGTDRSGRRRGIDWNDIEDAFPVALTMLVMPLTFNITYGIGAGFVSYVAIKLAKGHARQIHPAMYGVAFLFLLYFLRWALFDAKF